MTYTSLGPDPVDQQVQETHWGSDDPPGLAYLLQIFVADYFCPSFHQLDIFRQWVATKCLVMKRWIVIAIGASEPTY